MPYSGLGGMEVVDFLKSGQRLKQPDGCPDKMYFFQQFFQFHADKRFELLFDASH